MATYARRALAAGVVLLVVIAAWIGFQPQYPTPEGEMDWLVFGFHVPAWAPAVLLGIAAMSALAPVLFSWLSPHVRRISLVAAFVLAGLFAGSGVVNGIPPPERGQPLVGVPYAVTVYCPVPGFEIGDTSWVFADFGKQGWRWPPPMPGDGFMPYSVPGTVILTSLSDGLFRAEVDGTEMRLLAVAGPLGLSPCI
jgi:hypothetical protein